MPDTRLILIEGIPGSGKTTTAQITREWLASRGIPQRLYLEGDLDHPADFESAACLTAGEYARLLEAYPQQREFLEARKQTLRDEVWFPYRKIEVELGGDPDGLVTELARHEFYELPAERFTRLGADHWRDFTAQALKGGLVYVFECCFLQNPLTTLIARHNLDPLSSARHIFLLAETIRPLNPLLVYLDPPSVRGTLEAAAAGRPKEWLDFVIGYITGQAWGQANRQTGFDGMVRFYEERSALEKSFLEELGFPWITLQKAGLDWEAARSELKGFLEEHVEGVTGG